MGSFSDRVRRIFTNGPKVKLTTYDEVKSRKGHGYFVRTIEEPHRYMHFLGEDKGNIAYGLQDSQIGACLWTFDKAQSFVKEFHEGEGRTHVEAIRADVVWAENPNP